MVKKSKGGGIHLGVVALVESSALTQLVNQHQSLGKEIDKLYLRTTTQ